jgi:DNA-binding XRE family transcriptional regulator
MASRRSKRTLPTLGDKVREARKLAGMNQHQLAKAVGCSYTKVVHIETGKGAEPWLIDAVAKRLGFESLRDLVESHRNTDGLIHSTLLPAIWKAQFDKPESPEIHRKLLADIAASLADMPGLIEFTFSRPANSLIFGLRATIDIHRDKLLSFSYNLVYLVKHKGDEINAHIYKMRLPRITLDWPLSGLFENPVSQFPTLRGLVADYVARGRIKARDYPDGSTVLLKPGGRTARRSSSNPVSP